MPDASCEACFDGAVDPWDGGSPDASEPDPDTGVVDAGGGMDAAAWGWDGAVVEPYLCGSGELSATGTLDLGHAESIRTLRRTESRVLSQDTQHRWVLWDVASRRRIAEGVSRADSALGPASRVDLAGDLVLIPVEQAVELRRASDGALATTLPTTTPVALAPNASYLHGADATGLRAWSPQGAPLFERLGDYQSAIVHAAADALFVANGPAGATVIERVALDGTAQSTLPFAGSFQAFFDDGAHFIARLGEEVVVYTRDAAEVRRFPIAATALGGHGRYLWALINDDNPLCAYSLNAGEREFCVQVPRRSSVESTFGAVVVRGGERTAFSSDGLDLTGTRPLALRFSLPTTFTQIASDGAGRWALGDVDGALAVGQSFATAESAVRLGCGRALAMAGTPTLLALATADGFVRLLRVEGDRLTLTHTLPLAGSALALTRDGATLAVGKRPSDELYYEGEQSLRLFSLQPLEPVRYEPQRFDIESGRLFSFSLADARLALLDCAATATAGRCRAQVSALLAPTPLLAERMFDTVLRTDLPPIRASMALSPDGSKLALSYATSYPDRYNMHTLVYRDGQPIAVIPGSLAGWANEQALVVVREREQPAEAETLLVDLEGRQLARLGTWPFEEVVAIDGENFFAVDQNTIYRSADGGEVWTGPRLGAGRQQGATLGPARVAYTGEHRIVLYTWRDL